MKPNQHCRTRTRTQRRGVAILMVIAFYAVAVTMIGGWVRAALGHQQQVRRWHEKTQVRWLAEAGVRRAAARISSDKDYSGERWQIDAAEMGGIDSAEVVIRIETAETPGQANGESGQAKGQAGQAKGQAGKTPHRVRIIATAQYPASQQQRVQTTKSVEFRLPVASNRSGESS